MDVVCLFKICYDLYIQHVHTRKIHDRKFCPSTQLVRHTYLLSHGVATDISDGIGYREDLVSFRVGDFNAELLLQGHHNLHGIQRVKIKVILELGSGSDLRVGHLMT
jgi:hypothetical protein